MAQDAHLLLQKIEAITGLEQFTPGLMRISSYLDELALDGIFKKIIIVAGTNGKGETSRAMAHILQQEHISYALWTSPHQLSVCERFQSNGQDIELNELEQRVLNLEKKMLQKRIKLTFYEFLFVIFCEWAKTLKVDYLVLEVGLGGRLDAVKYFKADVVLLTSIARDHQNILGHYYRQIILEKLGVASDKSKIISMLALKYLKQICEKYCRDHNLIHLDAGEQLANKQFNYSERNQYLALMGAQLCLQKNISGQVLQGFQYSANLLFKQNEFLLEGFGAHNPDGLRKMIHLLQDSQYTNLRAKYDLIIMAFTQRPNSDLVQMVKMLQMAQLGSSLVLTVFDHPKAIGLNEARDLATGNVVFEENYREVLSRAQREQQKILVCGSYYFLSLVRAFISRLGQ